MREIQTRIPGISIRTEGLASAAHRAESRRLELGARYTDRFEKAKIVFDSSVQGLPTPQTPIHMIDASVSFNRGAVKQLARAQSDLDSLNTIGIRRTLAVLGVPLFPLRESKGVQHIAHRVVQSRSVLRLA